MSQFGLFLLLPVDTILQIQAKAVQMVLSGTTVMAWEGEGTSVDKKFTMNPSDVLEECNFALKQLEPQTYGYLLKTIKVFHA